MCTKHVLVTLSFWLLASHSEKFGPVEQVVLMNKEYLFEKGTNSPTLQYPSCISVPFVLRSSFSSLLEVRIKQGVRLFPYCPLRSPSRIKTRSPQERRIAYCSPTISWSSPYQTFDGIHVHVCQGWKRICGLVFF